MKTKVLIALALSSSAIITPAKAVNFGNHSELIESIRSTNTEFLVNPKECNEYDFMGWYNGESKTIVICQENRKEKIDEAVNWTEEDLDTIRHEAQHLIQDCMDGELNHKLTHVYKKPIQLADNKFDDEMMNWLSENYKDYALKDAILEFEAWAVASMNDPEMQSNDIKHFCF